MLKQPIVQIGAECQRVQAHIYLSMQMNETYNL